jgi:vitamin B12 transporter
MFRSIPATASIVLGLNISTVALALDDAEPADKVIVTATRYPVPVADVLPASFVIDRNAIERSLAPDITDLLRFRAGLEFGRNGGPGQISSLFLRGTDSNHTLVLLDGVRINPATVGGAALQNISPHLVERIEVVKGPRSTLYGTDAVGGVVQIFTRANQAEGLHTSAGYGSDATLTGSASGGWRNERAHLGFGVSYLDTDGYPPRVTDPRAGAFDELSFNLAGALDLGPGSLGATFWRAHGCVDYIGFSSRNFSDAHITQDFVNEAGAVHYDWQLGAWHSRVEVARMVEDLDQGRVRDSVGSFESSDYATTHRTTVGWQNDFDVARGQKLSLGVSVADETARGLDFGVVDTDIVNAYVQDQLEFGRHDVVVAVGYVDHETAGDHATWNVDYGVRLGSALRLVASAGSAFRAPDATDRFGFGGNIDLQPEESRNYELGLRYALASDQRLSLSAFNNDIDQLIAYFVTNPMTFDGEMRNIDRARIRGVEAAYEIDRSAWSLRAEAIYQEPEDRATGDQLLRRANENFTLSYLRRMGRFELGVDLLAAGERQDFGGIELDAYVLANLTARVNLGAGWSLSAQVENVLDEEYELANGYRTQDRAGYLQVAFTPALR